MAHAWRLLARVVAIGGLSLWAGRARLCPRSRPCRPTARNKYRLERRMVERQTVDVRFAPDELEVLALLNRADPLEILQRTCAQKEDFEVDYRQIKIVDIGPRASRWRRLKRTVLVATAFTLPVAVWGVAGQQPNSALAAATSPAAISRVVGAGEDTYAPVVDAVAPAVVTIHAEQRVEATQFRSPFEDDPLFREFFGDRLPRGEEGPQERGSKGSDRASGRTATS